VSCPENGRHFNCRPHCGLVLCANNQTCANASEE